jgi:ABC-2 type transport system permease protein
MRETLLVAQRELRERLLDRAFVVSTGISLAIVLAVVLLPRALGFGDPDHYRVGVAGAPELRERLTGELPGGGSVTATAIDAAEARRLVEDEELDAVILAGRVLVKEELPGDLAVAIEAARSERPAPLPVVALDPEPEDAGQRQAIAFLAVVILYGQLLGYAYWLALGVVEEKASRVVEILLGTIAPRQLLAGKVLGLGLLGMLQLVVIGAVSIAIATVAGALDVPSDAIAAVGITLVWFVLGYAFYSLLFGAVAATVSRQEDLQNVTTPMTLVILASLFLAFVAMEGGTVADVASVAPPFSAMVMPPLLAGGEASWSQAALAAGLLVAVTAALVPLAGRLYEGAILRTGGRVPLRVAWRSRVG